MLRNIRLTRTIVFFLIFVLVFSTPGSAKKNSSGKKKYQISARAAIFSDSTKVKRLYGKSVHTKVLPASTTKVMTALVVMQHLPLDRYITVSKRATQVQPTKADLVPGEKYKVRDLLYAILIKSANDASVVLAEAVAGSEQKFVGMMNKKAKQIGAKHTRFANSHGLPSAKGTQYTTAYDMYLIFRKALKYPFFRSAIKYKYRVIRSDKGRKIKLKSHNKILFFNWKKKIYGKTGYTKAAKSCFVGTIQKGKSTLIIAVFGCSRRWTDIKHIVSYYGGIAL